MPRENPVSTVEFLEEQNIRDIALTREEFERILKIYPGDLQPALLCAYPTVMR